MTAQVLPEVDTNAGGPPIGGPLRWAEARRLAFDSARPLPPTSVALADGIERILASDVRAPYGLPHYASSAMDGWAVNGGGPWSLVDAEQDLGTSEASPIVTGGVIPPGAEAVLPVENGQYATDAQGKPCVLLRNSPGPGELRTGQHIRKAGEEAAVGDTLITAGTILNPAHIALAAVAGFDQLQVLGKPQVSLLLTGSEVIPAGIPRPGQVRDTFGPQLGAVIRMLGGQPGEQRRVGDSYDEWLTALDAGRTAAVAPDVIVTTGGTGRSGSDHFRNAIAALGGRLLIDGIAMRPGHPAVLAKLPNGCFVVGLPGNPLAAMMALLTVGSPLLAALGHRPLADINRLPCGTVVDAHKAATRLMPFRLVNGLATPAQHLGPGMMRGLAASEGVMVVPSRGVQLGEPVPVLALPWRGPLPSVPAKGEPAAWHA